MRGRPEFEIRDPKPTECRHLNQWRRDPEHKPEGSRHCPNFLWGFPGSVASCRPPPLSDSVGLRSCCWLLVCAGEMRRLGFCLTAVLPFCPLHCSGLSFYCKKGGKHHRKTSGKNSTGATESTMGKGEEKMGSESPGK